MRCFLSGMDDPSCSSRFLVLRLQATAKLIAYRINRRTAGFTNEQQSQRSISPDSRLLRADTLGHAGGPCAALPASYGVVR